MRGSSRKSIGFLVLYMIVGAVLGGILGELIASSTALSGIAPMLVKTYPVFDLPPVSINLYVIKLMVGFQLYPNLISIIGIVLAIIFFRRF